MTKLSDEKRAELLVELDKIITEIRSLAGMIRGTTGRLDKIAKSMMEDVFAGAERLPTGMYSRSPPEWEPSEFDLVGLKKNHVRLRELIEKRNELEKQLGITIK
jgi:hypothetical protein